MDGDIVQGAAKNNATAASVAEVQNVSMQKYTNVSLIARSITGVSTTADFQMKLRAEM